MYVRYFEGVKRKKIKLLPPLEEIIVGRIVYLNSETPEHFKTITQSLNFSLQGLLVKDLPVLWRDNHDIL